MSLAAFPLPLVALFLIQPTPPASHTPSVAPMISCGDTAAASKNDSGKAQCEYRQGIRYVELGRFDDALQHCSAAMALDGAGPASSECFGRALAGIQRQRREDAERRLKLVYLLIHRGALSSAQDQLKSLVSDEKQSTVKYGALPELEAKIDAATFELAKKQSHQWPAYIPTFAGLQQWLPGVISATGRIMAFCLIGAIAYGLLLFPRYLHRLWVWHDIVNLKNPVKWSVSAIADDTKQAAAGALIDALNVDYNPLFQELYTSSFLAVPPALQPASSSHDPSVYMWRNFLTDVPKHGRVRGYLSELIEQIELPIFSRHRFYQVRAYEDISIKVGIASASLGAIANFVRGWWKKGWPSVTGSVFSETIGARDFASVRLISNFGLRRGNEKSRMVFQDENLKGEQRLKDFFTDDRTLSVFASTPIDESADAVALASQRAAFRLLYRLAMRPADPGLAIAASSFRQGVRLLNTIL
jgi:hypothetical protein